MSPLEQSKKRFANEQVREISHPAGLVLRLPESLEAQMRPDGFYVTPRDPSQRNMRYPVGATVRLHPNEAQPEGEWRQKETIGERVIWYRVTGGDGYGSGEQSTSSMLGSHTPTVTSLISKEIKENQAILISQSAGKS